MPFAKIFKGAQAWGAPEIFGVLFIFSSECSTLDHSATAPYPTTQFFRIRDIASECFRKGMSRLHGKANYANREKFRREKGVAPELGYHQRQEILKVFSPFGAHGKSPAIGAS